jgi:hypothetical protein
MPPLTPVEQTAAFEKTLGEILLIVKKIHPEATSGEKLVRIAWAIGNLPAELRDVVVNEAKNRVMIQWATGGKAVSPTEF